MESKIIKGAAYVLGNKLYQDQVLVTVGYSSGSQTAVLISDIWEDLTSDSGTYKTNGKGYFYWEYQMTDMSNDDLEVTVQYECPYPKADLFDWPYEPDAVVGDYSKYYVERLKTASENYENASTIQRKEITFPGSTYYDQNGDKVEVAETVVANSDLADITNLLMMY